MQVKEASGDNQAPSDLQQPGSSDFNSSPSVQNGCHFTDDKFKCIFVKEKFCILIKVSLKFVPNGPIDNTPAWV